MNTLHLTLKKKWFDMIASGFKREEYREIKPYWAARFSLTRHDAVRFRNGYSKNSPSITVRLLRIRCGIGNVGWGAPDGKVVFILELGEILDVKK